MQTRLLIIDPQEDFCNPSEGALYVPGAENDMTRLATLVQCMGEAIDAIHVTLDSHHYVHIAHPIWWRDPHGVAPAPFTCIRLEDVQKGRWFARDSRQATYSEQYLMALERNGRYPLCIWPYHCLMGSRGHAVTPILFSALTEWESRFKVVDYIPKGSNIRTEHYSAIVADVPDPDDPLTHINTRLMDALRGADTILIAGEAGSHCVANTVRDIMNAFSDAADIQKLTLLTDAFSAVPGFEEQQEHFLREARDRGVKTALTTDFL